MPYVLNESIPAEGRAERDRRREAAREMFSIKVMLSFTKW
jgi:hypothetical protein